MWAGHVTASLRLIFGLSFDVSGALGLDLPFCRGTLNLGKYYIQYSFRVWCYLYALSIYRNLTELCTTPGWAVLLVQCWMSNVCCNKRTTHARWRIHRTLLYSRHHVSGASADLMLHLPFFFFGRKKSKHTKGNTTEQDKKLENWQTVAMQNFRQRDH